MQLHKNQKVLAFLRQKLTDADFTEFLSIASTETQSPPSTQITREGLNDYRTWNHLAKEGIHTIYDAVSLTEADLLRIPGFGRRSLNILKDWLAEHGWRIGEIPKRT